MTSNEINILLSSVCLILVGHSWYVHYKVKDGLARLMLLWGCGFIFMFLLVRVINFTLVNAGIIDLSQSRTIAMYSIWFIYLVVVGQWYIQRGGVERHEDNKLQKDRKELKKFRKEK